jgi:hypothetical protein
MLAFAGKRIQEFGFKSTEAYKCDAADTKLPDGKFTNVYVSFGPIVFVRTLSYHRSSNLRSASSFTLCFALYAG